MRRIKAGIIGTGFIGEVQIESLRRLGFVDVHAIAASSRERAEAKAAQLGVPRAYDDWRELLADADIEVVHICTPNDLHYPVAKAALQQGKHVICEKPLVLAPEEARELIAIASGKGLVNAVHFNLRYYPLIQQARAMVQRGGLGKIFSFQGTYFQDWLFHDTDFNWRLESEISGASRAMADIGSHLLDLAEFVSLERIKSVCSQTAIFHPVRKKASTLVETYKKVSGGEYEEVAVTTEDYASILVEFHNGARGTAAVSQVAAGNKNRLSFELNGSKGSLRWNSENPNELWIGRRDEHNEIVVKDPAFLDEAIRHMSSYPGGHAEGFADTSKQMFRQVYAYIANDGRGKGIAPEFPTFEDGLREVILCDSVMESARLKQWLEV